MTPAQRADRVLTLLRSASDAAYIGEAVSQLEHAQQAAMRLAGAGDDEVTLAALLHDVGHLLPGLAPMDGWGVVDHEGHGARWLASLGFSPRLCRIVALHVAAKRFLCATDAVYAARLSAASRATLAWQGGPMTGEELRFFQDDPDLEAILAVRHADEAAKVVGLALPPVEVWRPLILAHLEHDHESTASDT